MPLPALTFDKLPSAILHWKLVELLLDDGALDRACKALVQYAASHKGATQDEQFILDGESVGPIEPTERALRYSQWYWRRAFKLLVETVFVGLERDLPPAPLVGVRWETEFKKLCEELNAARVVTQRLQRVQWTQRRLDEWWHRYHEAMPSLAALLEFYGASTARDTIEAWRAKDRQLTVLIELLQAAESMPAAEFQSLNSQLQALRLQGARVLE
jgi:hypothetical protein